jgi:hypothetical protein
VEAERQIRVLKGLPDRFEVCYGASCGYGHYHDLLRPLAARVLVAHHGQLRLIFRSKSKNDRNDAWARRRRSTCPPSRCGCGAAGSRP